MSSTAQVCQELPGCSFWDFSLPSYKPVLLSEAWHSQTGAIPETYGYLELQSLKEPGKPICPICSSLDEETRTQKTALISLMPPNSLGEWGLPRRGEDVTCVIMCEPCKWCGSGITNPMDGLENRGSILLKCNSDCVTSQLRGKTKPLSSSTRNIASSYFPRLISSHPLTPFPPCSPLDPSACCSFCLGCFSPRYPPS